MQKTICMIKMQDNKENEAIKERTGGSNDGI